MNKPKVKYLQLKKKTVILCSKSRPLLEKWRRFIYVKLVYILKATVKHCKQKTTLSNPSLLM